MNPDDRNGHLSTFDAQGRFAGSVWGHPIYVLEATANIWPHHSVRGLYDDAWWFDGSQACERPHCPVIVDGLTLRRVRPGSAIAIEGQQHECAEGGDVELSFQYPGTYEITITCWPDLDGSYTIENPPPSE